MIHAIIPTRKSSQINKNLISYLKEAGINILAVENKGSIFEAFTTALQYIGDLDIAILCHDDIEIWSDKVIFLKWLNQYAFEKDIGFIGVAGTKKMTSTGVWWNNKEHNQNLAGMAYHPIPGNPKLTPLTYFGPPFAHAEAMDGVFLAIQGRKLKKIGTKKPRWMPEESNWDFYDISMTYKATKMGYKNIVLPIQIFHESPGVPRESWESARKAFVKEYF